MIGVTLCALLALLASALLYGSTWKFALPLVFIGVVVLLAMQFGRFAGILGSLASALVFAYFLYLPFGSVHVSSDRARDSLNWLLLGGISLSMLFPKDVAERSPGQSRRPPE